MSQTLNDALIHNHTQPRASFFLSLAQYYGNNLQRWWIQHKKSISINFTSAMFIYICMRDLAKKKRMKKKVAAQSPVVWKALWYMQIHRKTMREARIWCHWMMMSQNSCPWRWIICSTIVMIHIALNLFSLTQVWCNKQ